MMQFGPPRHPGPQPRGIEGWFPPLLVGLTSLALVAALTYFVLVANSMRGRIPMPPATIPLAMGAAAFLGLYMLLRAIGQLRQAWRALRGGRDPGPADP